MNLATSRATLTKDPQSFLARIAMEDTELASDKDESGAFLIDRDPQYFSPILNFLRHGKVHLDRNVMEEAVLEEAEFYNVAEMVKILKERSTVGITVSESPMESMSTG